MMLLVCSTYAQKRNWEWVFGHYNRVSFASGAPVASFCGIDTNEGSASICDTSGKFLFYTDGIFAYDSTGAYMLNGSGLFGSYISAQSALIVPAPSNTQQYYLFTLSNWTDISTKFAYSIVDMSLNNGMGAVSSVKNVILNSNAREQLTAVPHANGQDVWIMVHEANNTNFCVYLLSANGIDTVPIVSPVGMMYSGNNRYGTMRFSHNCTKLVSNLGGDSPNETVQLFDFDNATGIVSNPVTLGTTADMTDAYYSEFSPDDSKLYLTAYNNFYIYQFDLNATNIPSSIIDVANTATSSCSSLQLAPDGKIYIQHQVSSMAAINNPNNAGIACNYVDNALFLPGTPGLCLPNFYNYDCGSTTSIAENQLVKLVTVYPNPFRDELSIEADNEDGEIFIYDIASRKLLQMKFVNSVKLNTEQLAKGIYFYELRNRSGVVKKGKVVRN